MVISADTLVYFGALEDAMSGAANALKPGGVLAFTVEAEPVGSTEKFRLHKSGRYSHSSDYVRECLEAAGFTVLLIEGAVLRKGRRPRRARLRRPRENWGQAVRIRDSQAAISER